ncbi:hypothetical protein LMIY3S_02229 [Labrys miyagiensis]
MKLGEMFEKVADRVSRKMGHPAAFMVCCTIVVVWAISGPIFGFSDTWQLLINTGTTIVTFLMVFLIQNTQNRDTAALHAKLDELLLTSAAQDSFVGIEHLSEEEVQKFRDICAAAAEKAGKARLASGSGEPAASAEKRSSSRTGRVSGGTTYKKEPTDHDGTPA